MIVKVKELDVWHIYDNITCINYQPCTQEMIDTIVSPVLLVNDEKSTEFILLELRTKDASGIYIVFDDVACICNDNGKTIETIKPNKQTYH